MKNLIVIIFSLFIISCANLSGSVSRGYYTSANKEFQIKTPVIPKLTAHDGNLNGRQFVDFYQARGYWKEHGLYSVEWYKPAKSITNDKEFYFHIKNAVPALVRSNYGGRGTFTEIDTRELKVNNAVAYQFVADGSLDSLDAVWAGTAINFEHHIAIISIVVASKNQSNNELHGATVQANIPWNKYNSFLQSFIKLKSQ